jgi:hypothetical protein
LPGVFDLVGAFFSAFNRPVVIFFRRLIARDLVNFRWLGTGYAGCALNSPSYDEQPHPCVANAAGCPAKFAGPAARLLFDISVL